MAQTDETIVLPRISLSGTQSLPQLLSQRRSVRDFQARPLPLGTLGQLLWAAQGITHAQGLRSAPSAGALYPLELYVALGEVEGLAPGIYRYLPQAHQLEKTAPADQRKKLARAAYQQSWLGNAPIVVVFAAVYERTTWKYGERGLRYVHMEAGHAAQNLFLQAESLGLGTVIVGAFDDDEIQTVLQLPHDQQPLILMPVGQKLGSGHEH